MKYRKLGGSGVFVSEVALGSWLTYGQGIDQKTTESCVKAAFDCGINFIDTADVYGLGACEEALGRAIRGVSRKDYVLASKAFFPTGDGPNDKGLSRKHLTESLDASLARLGTDYLDLYQCHRYDPDVPIRELVRTMDDFIRRGRILYWGVSQWPADKILEVVKIALAIGAEPPVTNQPRYNLLDRVIEDEIIETAANVGMGQIVYSPLAQGLLTGKYCDGAMPKDSRARLGESGEFIRRNMTPENLERADKFAQLAKVLEIPASQLALSWCLRQPAVASVIIGASRPGQIKENAKASGYTLDQASLEAIDRILTGS
ncbi:MAG: aldo/keto reductase family protein [Planctomycetota bacterium]